MKHHPRLPDWMCRLDQLVCTRRTAPYTWGQFDCCTLVADVIEAITGFDHMAGIRGTYASEQEAYALIERHGGLVAILTNRLGKPLPVGLAQTGDVGISGTATVFLGGGVWHGQAEMGLVMVQAPSVIWRCTGV